MRVKLQKLLRSGYIAVALALAIAGMSPVLLQKAHAFPVGNQVQIRSIELSSSASNASGVSYDVKFNSGSPYTIKGLILDFCDGSSTPIIGDSTCNTTGLTNFDLGATPSVTLVSGLTGSWTSTSLNSHRTLKLTKSAGDVLSVGTTVEFTISGVHNPSNISVPTDSGTFYSRLITYASASGDIASYAPGTEGSVDATDYGGFALSTANVINITAKVQESMTFCVSGVAPGPDCGAVTGPSVTQPDLKLGHGANTILDSTRVDTAQAFTQLSTNAGAVNIRMTNSAVSGGLNATATHNIPAVNSGANTPNTIGAGVAAFGLFVANGSGGTGGPLNADANYNDGTSTHYGMDTTTSGANVLSTYGDVIASASAPVNNIGNTLTFAAQASNTTPAGIYTATITLIATGSF